MIGSLQRRRRRWNRGCPRTPHGVDEVPLTDEDSITAPLPADYPYRTRMRRREYEAEKKRLQIELLKVQSWVKDTGQRIVILFEGRDAAGKGGTIKRFTEHLNPRGARVVALEKPNDQERGQWYFQRYIEHLPTVGEIVFEERAVRFFMRRVAQPVAPRQGSVACLGW